VPSSSYFNTGGRYNPTTNGWTATSTTGAPDPRIGHTAVWTGSQMIVWGGQGNIGLFNTGGRYCAAAPPPPPIAHPATYIASNSFTANWSSVAGATGYRLDVSRNSSFSTYVAGYQNLNVFNTTSRSVTGLNPSTTYYYRVRAYNASGTSGNSNVVSVTTLSPTGPPVAITNPATLIASFSATLNGSVDPHGLTTTVYFQYGRTISYGSTTLSQIKTGNTYQSVSANVSGLTANSTYHFRLVATNSAGTRYGVDRTFTTLTATGPPVVTTNPASLIASFSATLNGSVDPHGLPTTVYFQYGTTVSYGLTTAPQSKTGNTYQNVTANISGLTASTTYHFRIVATNNAGTRYGSDRTFTTLSATGPPVVITNPATNIQTNTATLNGTVNPHGLTTTVYFQYGTTAAYGNTSASQIKTGNAYQNVSANISGLLALTTYHFRIVGTNNSGTTYGGDRTFTTQPY
jgi:Fibronectin type III domain